MIPAISAISGIGSGLGSVKPVDSGTGGGDSFSNMLGSALGKLDAGQQQASASAQDLATGKSADVGQKIAGTLNSTGTRAYVLDATRAVHGDLGMLHPDDVVLALSHSGESEEIVRLLPSLRTLSRAIVALTSNARSTLAEAADAGDERGQGARARDDPLPPVEVENVQILALHEARAPARAHHAAEHVVGVEPRHDRQLAKEAIGAHVSVPAHARADVERARRAPERKASRGVEARAAHSRHQHDGSPRARAPPSAGEQPFPQRQRPHAFEQPVNRHARTLSPPRRRADRAQWRPTGAASRPRSRGGESSSPG